MAKQTTEEYVKHRYPLAFIETINSELEKHYIVKNGIPGAKYIASGSSEAEAWKNAKEKLKTTPKETAEQFVKTYFPRARAERQTQGRIIGMSKPYYLIRDGRNPMYMASSDTKSKAWKQAEDVVRNILAKQIEQKPQTYDGTISG
jgi:hypothetical protein